MESLATNGHVPQDFEVALRKRPRETEMPDYSKIDIGVELTMATMFAQNAKASYDKQLIGEDAAKRMYIGALMLGAENGMAVVVMGHPGGGKSALTKYGYTVVGDINQDQVGKVPHIMDLSPTELMGKDSEITKTIYDKDDELVKSERIAAAVKAILHPGVKVIQFDEGNRTSPLAINAALEVMQEGRISVTVDGREVEISELDLICTAMNNHGTKWTNKLDPAFINRHGMGVFMNERQPGKLTEGAMYRLRNPSKMFHSRPFDAVIDLERLHEIRGALPNMPVRNQEYEYHAESEANMLEYLSVHGMDIADTRTADQTIRMAQALAMIDGEVQVQKSNIDEALALWLAARLGMTGQISTNQQARDIVDSKFTLTLDRINNDRAERAEKAKEAMEKAYEAWLTQKNGQS